MFIFLCAIMDYKLYKTTEPVLGYTAIYIYSN